MHLATDLLQRDITVSFAHRVYFTHGVFSPENPLLGDLLVPMVPGQPAKVLLVVDIGVVRAFPHLVETATAYFSRLTNRARLVCSPLVLPGGEPAKNHSILVDDLRGLVDEYQLCRHSYLIAAGGGAILDLAGFAAATAQRGIRHIRLPTTTLSQADGSVSVKNGINAFGKKNFIGTYAPPYAVVNDTDFWPGLTAAGKRAGLIEAIKVALIRDAAFFEELERNADLLARFEPETMNHVIRRCAELHLDYIAGSGDPFECGAVRPLEFGHWAAHKLEQISDFTLAHGAALGLGLTLDTYYSYRRGLLSKEAAERVLALVQKLGFALFDPLMLDNDSSDTWLLEHGLQEFGEHLGGELTLTLPTGIGQGVEVHDMDLALLRTCLLELRERFGSRPAGG